MHSGPVTSRPRARVCGYAAILVMGAAACAVGSGAESAQTSQPQQPSIVATAGDLTVTLAEVDAKALELDASEFRGMSLGQALFEARQLSLDEIIGEKLLEAEAKQRGLGRDEYVTREATGSLAAVTDAEVERWYRENAARVGGQSLETVRDAIRSLLVEVRRRGAIDGLVAKLRAATKVTTHLEPPRTEVEVAANDPALGPAQAAVEIIEFSDFQ